MPMTANPPIHGNYHGYYTKRPSQCDPRLALLPRSLFVNSRVLDIGCNEGWVTCEIAQSYNADRVIGVDIDDTLVRAAWRRRRSLWSQQQPHCYSGSTVGKESVADHPKKRKLTSVVDVPVSASAIIDYFPASLEHMFGPLPITTSSTHSNQGFPHNVTFRTANWVDTSIPEDAEGYDVVLGLSITKWIHLNSGDLGLQSFFRRVHAVLRPRGTFILEPQAWDTYAKAKRMDPKLRENGKHLELRPENFERILQEIGFDCAVSLGTTGEGGFKRSLFLYKKTI